MKGCLIAGLLIGWAFSAQAEESKPMMSMSELQDKCESINEDNHDGAVCLGYVAGVLDTFERVCLPKDDASFYYALGQVIGGAMAFAEAADPKVSAALAIILAAAPWQCKEGVASAD